jgi:hypothetical protein
MSVGETEGFMGLDVLFGMGRSSFLSVVFFISGFLKAGAV